MNVVCSKVQWTLHIFYVFFFQEQLDALEEKWDNRSAATKVLKLELFLT
jgi:hypothetical protein